MADEEKESRIKVENLPQPEQEQELTPEEAKQVQGGTVFGDGSVRGIKSNISSIQDGTSNTIMTSEFSGDDRRVRD